MSLHGSFLSYTLCLLNFWLFNADLPVTAQARLSESERMKELHKMQFKQNFKNIQLSSQSMLKSHEQGKLNSDLLTKYVKEINKTAKTLRALIALGNLAEAPLPFDKEIRTNEKFDKAIRELHQLVYDFAHSPIHQNSKVFNAKEAAKAQVQLLTIIELSKTINEVSKHYTPTH